jgi:hypothetical protein
MSISKWLGPLLLALLVAPAAADPIAAHDEAEAIRNDQQREIARILEADNLDPSALSAREVAAAIARIPRGQAPDDFWAAYQAHVRAWRISAAAGEKLASIADSKYAERESAMTQVMEAEIAISATFAEVARIAESYGVAMPVPPSPESDMNAM